MSEIVTRFAPSPTGLLHLGNVRTALLNWLYARKHGGRFLLRFEDTDRERSEKQFIQAICDDLGWLGLDWDGDILFQSDQAAQHRQALDRLAEQEMAYRCFCTEGQLALDRKLAASRGLPPRYSGRCRSLASEESASRAEHEAHVWRLPVHRDDGEVIVPDVLRGDVHFACHDLDDPVIVRSDGSFTFLLPNAVDDAIDSVTHVMRGDDHLSNSAYQVWLLQHLDMAVPAYLHHGLLLGRDGAKLSKRSGSHSAAELRQEGLMPMALMQAMVRLGHPNISEDALSLDALMQHFDARHVSTTAIRWSDDDMWRWHTRLLHNLPAEALLAQVREHLPEADESFALLVQGNMERAEDVLAYRRMLDAGTALSEEAESVANDAGNTFYRTALDAWNGMARNENDWKIWVQAIKEGTGRTGKGLFMPLRVALTGALHGPEMSGIVGFLGEGGVRKRLEDMIQRIS
ncbi:MAG: glutamate--tRNA ligase [Mariprofundaceae bacterium]|nr:glutamate--tRNA ligase [Mariprofundaceae bacterium]